MNLTLRDLFLLAFFLSLWDTCMYCTNVDKKKAVVLNFPSSPILVLRSSVHTEIRALPPPFACSARPVPLRTCHHSLSEQAIIP